MSNRELEAAWAYHNSTKHSYQSIRADSHYLDWENQPLPFKIYSSLEPISLPHNFSSSEMTALSAISATGAYAGGKCIPDLEALAVILHFSAGIPANASGSRSNSR